MPATARDDGDGLVDCDDPDGNTDDDCAPVEVCSEALDADGDGLAGCADPSCGGASCGAFGQVCVGGWSTCPQGDLEADCTDGLDGDCNGRVDCEDPACAPTPYGVAGGLCASWVALQCGEVVSAANEGLENRLDAYPCSSPLWDISGPEWPIEISIDRGRISSRERDILG